MDVPPPVEIVVTAPRLPEAPSDDAFSITIIAGDTISQTPRLDDALTATPGVALFRRSDSSVSSPTVQGLSIRGVGPSGAGRALVTLDGVPQGDPFGGWVIWGALPPETIDSALIARGAGAGPYGAGALTGVVALQERVTPGLVIDAEGASAQLERLALFSETEHGASDLMTAFTQQSDNGWIGVDAGRGAADQPFWSDSRAAVVRLQQRLDGALISLRMSGYDEHRGAGLTGADSGDSGSTASLTYVSNAASRFSWRLQAWARQSDLTSTFVAVAPDRNSTTPASDQYATPAFGWGANATARWSGASGGVELGADFRLAEGHAKELSLLQAGVFNRRRISGGDTFGGGVYVEAWRDLGDTLLTGGVRADSWRAYNGSRIETNTITGATTLALHPDDVSRIAPTARFGMRRALGDYFMRASASLGFRPPTLNELYRPFRVGNDVTEANADLKPETSLDFDAAFGSDRGAVHWSAGVFFITLDDAITNVTQGVGPGVFPPGDVAPAGGVFRVRENAGSILAHGVEAQAEGGGADWRWNAALSYTDAHVHGGAGAPELTGLRPAQSPAWSISAGTSYQISGATTFSANARYESDRFDDDLNSRDLGDALLVDLRLDHRLTGHGKIYLALDNAFNVRADTSVTSDGVATYGRPRTVRIGLRFAR